MNLQPKIRLLKKTSSRSTIVCTNVEEEKSKKINSKGKLDATHYQGWPCIEMTCLERGSSSSCTQQPPRKLARWTPKQASQKDQLHAPHESKNGLIVTIARLLFLHIFTSVGLIKTSDPSQRLLKSHLLPNSAHNGASLFPISYQVIMHPIFTRSQPLMFLQRAHSM